LEHLRKLDGVTAISLSAEEKAILVNGDYQSVVTVKGVDETLNTVSHINEHIVRGKYFLGNTDKPSIVMGVGIENAVNADVEKAIYPLTLYMPSRSEKANLGTIDGMNSYNVAPTGTFMIQEDFDNKYVFTNIGFVKYMLDMKPDEYSSCELKLDASKNQDRIIENIQNLLGNTFELKTRYQQNQSLYAAMQLVKWVIYLVTCLILIVAAFNIIGALTMLVLEKQKDIAVLKAIGATNATIQQIFLAEGVLLSLIGGVIGITVATAICLLQIKFHLIQLSGGTFLIDYYPVKLLATDYWVVFLTILVIALIAAWVPAQKAAREQVSLKS
jgi:lipoprotein-releasing system permease protein